MSVNNGTESIEFIFFMNRLNENISIDMFLNILKCVNMHAVKILSVNALDLREYSSGEKDALLK